MTNNTVTLHRVSFPAESPASGTPREVKNRTFICRNEIEA